MRVRKDISRFLKWEILLSILETDTYTILSNFISSLKAFLGANVAGWLVGLYAFIPLGLWSNTNALCVI